MKKKPWYLKTFWVYAICMVIPPLGYYIVWKNLKNLEESNEDGENERIYYLAIATISLSFWVLKFAPLEVRKFVLCILATILIGNSLRKLYRKIRIK